VGKGSHTHSGKGLTQTVGKGSHTQWEKGLTHTQRERGSHTHTQWERGSHTQWERAHTHSGKGLTHTVGKGLTHSGKGLTHTVGKGSHTQWERGSHTQWEKHTGNPKNIGPTVHKSPQHLVKSTGQLAKKTVPHHAKCVGLVRLHVYIYIGLAISVQLYCTYVLSLYIRTFNCTVHTYFQL